MSAAAAEQTSHQSGQVQQAQKQTRRIGVSRQVEVAAPLESKTQETENQKFVQHEQKLKALEQQVEQQQYTWFIRKQNMKIIFCIFFLNIKAIKLNLLYFMD